jgi:hypothetical protein
MTPQAAAAAPAAPAAPAACPNLARQHTSSSPSCNPQAAAPAECVPKPADRLLLLLLLLPMLLQVLAYHKMFRDKYMKLGATSVEFIHQYSPNADVAAHAIVVGTPKNVFLIFR